MTWREARLRTICGLLVAVLVAGVFTFRAPRSAYAAQFVFSGSTPTGGGTSVSVNILTPTTAGDLLILVCSTDAAATITTSTGFTTAESQSGTVSQEIAYKIAAGTETSVTCNTSSKMDIGAQILEYSGIENVNPLDAVNGTSSTGTGSAMSSGSVTTTNADDLLFAAGAIRDTVSGSTNNQITFGGTWSSSFINETTGFATTKSGNGKNAVNTNLAFTSSDLSVSAAGSYSTGSNANATGTWAGQIAAFKIAPPQAFSVDIVNGSGGSVSGPSVTMAAASEGFSCQTSTGTLGTSTQKIRVTNTTPTDNNGWTLDLAASSANWSDGSGHTYKYNDSTGSGCTNGQLTVVPTSETITPESGCTNTGVSSLAASTAYTSTAPVRIASAGSTASYYCYWDITGLGLSQKIPASQYNGTYSIGLTMTLTAQ